MPRPKPETDRKTCSVILPVELLTLLEDIAAREDRTLSSQIRHALVEWIKDQDHAQQPA